MPSTIRLGFVIFSENLSIDNTAKIANKGNKNIRFNNEFYVTPVYNELIRDGKKVTTFPVIKNWALGTPDEIKKFVEDKPFNQFRY